MQELQKLHRIIGKQIPGAPHEVLLRVGRDHGHELLEPGSRIQ